MSSSSQNYGYKDNNQAYWEAFKNKHHNLFFLKGQKNVFLNAPRSTLAIVSFLSDFYGTVKEN